MSTSPSPSFSIIYSGLGAGPVSTYGLADAVRKTTTTPPLLLDASYIARDGCQGASSFFIGGGSAFQMAPDLLKIAQKIKEYLDTGGKGCFICAGSIAAATNYTENNMKYYPTFCSLKLYPGTAFGYPLLGYEIQRDMRDWTNNARACTLNFGLKTGKCYWNLSPHLDPSVTDQKVIASYGDVLGAPPAIVSQKFGKGKIVLSGPHPEMWIHNDSDPQLKSIQCAKELEEALPFQQELFDHIHKELTFE